jgi:hypothetical protein
MPLLPALLPSALPTGFSAPTGFLAQTGGWGALVPWLLVMGLVLLGGSLACLYALLQRQADLVAIQRRQSTELAELRNLAASWIGTRESLDLRRIEHVLVDLRDDQQRVEDALLRTIELGLREREDPPAAASAALDVDTLIERVTNRLLSLGFERVQVLADREALAALGGARGEVPLEARRAGVLHKGRALVQGGRIVDVEMQPPYAMFP